MADVLKFQTLFYFCVQIKCWFFQGWNSHNALVRIANREDPDQSASSKAI